MQIFLLGTRMFMYIDTTDGFEPARDFARINADPRSAEWNTLMRTMQQPVPEAREGEWWALMERVFDTEWFQHRRQPADE
jgi:L-rhamnose mutarotase